jgi:hypothetical protein
MMEFHLIEYLMSKCVLDKGESSRYLGFEVGGVGGGAVVGNKL